MVQSAEILKVTCERDGPTLEKTAELRRVVKQFNPEAVVVGSGYDVITNEYTVEFRGHEFGSALGTKLTDMGYEWACDFDGGE